MTKLRPEITRNSVKICMRNYDKCYQDLSIRNSFDKPRVGLEVNDSGSKSKFGL
jgi:hypothetical protein